MRTLTQRGVPAGIYLEQQPVQHTMVIWKPPPELKRLQFVGEYSEQCRRMLTGLYSSTRKHLPQTVLPGMAAVETQVAAVSTPLLDALNSQSRRLLREVDRKVCSLAALLQQSAVAATCQGSGPNLKQTKWSCTQVDGACLAASQWLWPSAPWAAWQQRGPLHLRSTPELEHGSAWTTLAHAPTGEAVELPSRLHTAMTSAAGPLLPRVSDSALSHTACVHRC